MLLQRTCCFSWPYSKLKLFLGLIVMVRGTKMEIFTSMKCVLRLVTAKLSAGVQWQKMFFWKSWICSRLVLNHALLLLLNSCESSDSTNTWSSSWQWRRAAAWQVRCSYLRESSLFSFLQRDDSSTLQQTAERQTLALPDRRHLLLGAQTAVNLVELEHKQSSTNVNNMQAELQHHLLEVWHEVQ